ncbi:MAG: hypothetical protein HGB18_04335 [Candidatus Moranbacteria bacterium]|nr:hypothetical protein [Candidatus Moranbacteria bacterium]
MDHIKKHAGLIAGAMLALLFAVSLAVSWQESTIMDEKAHIPAGYSYVRFGDMRLNPEHPPLLKDLAGLALLPLQPAFPTDSPLWQEGTNEQWTIGDRLLADNDTETVTFVARIPIILLALLLGFVIFRWTKELAGSVAALFALLLYAADPNIIAHDHYVTTDLGIAAVIFFAFWSFMRFLKRPGFRSVVLFGVLLGIAQLTKFSAVLLFPYFGLVATVYALTASKPDQVAGSVAGYRFRSLLSVLLRYAGAVLVCFALIYAVYVPHVMNMPGEKLPAIARMMINQDIAIGRFAVNFVDITSKSAVLKPYSEYFLGVFMVFARVAGGNTFYFFGNVSNHANPWYFPAVFALKETIPLLFLIVSTSFYSLYRIIRYLFRRPVRGWCRTFAHSFQGHTTQYAMFGFIALYAFVSITGNLNIGFRHLFPILPLTYVLIAKTVFDFIRHEDFRGEKAAKAVLVVLSLWIAAIPVLTYPSYLSYFNEAAGGHGNGYRYVTDSNYDWGQDLKRLRSFVDGFDACKSGAALGDDCAAYSGLMQYPAIETIKVDYFGGDNPKHYLGDRFVGGNDGQGWAPGWYAISVGFFQESIHKTVAPGTSTYRWLVDGGYRPVARAGDSILIFYVPPIED